MDQKLFRVYSPDGSYRQRAQVIASFDSFEEAVRWAENNRPTYIIKPIRRDARQMV